MLDRASLDELSRSFAYRLFSDFGEWEGRAELLMDDQRQPTGAFCLSIPQPHGERTLEIRTDEGEITLSFGFWHAHYGSYLGISDEEAISEALSATHGILEEQCVVVLSYKNGAWAGSSLEDVRDPLPPSRPGETAETYSWHGTHDRDL